MNASPSIRFMPRRAVLLGAIALAACANVSAAETRSSRALDQRFDALTREAEIDGAGFIVLDSAGRLYERFVGAIAGPTPIPLASATKWLTVALIMGLVDDGVLSLDGALGDYLPDAPASHRAITLRQLLSHTSGIDPELALRLPPRASLREMTQSLLASPLIGVPGEVFAYGGSSMQVAAYVAELRTGRDWRALFNERLVAPLALTSAEWRHPIARNLEGGAPMVAGGLVLSPNDLATFMSAMLASGIHNGRRILSVASVEQIERLQTGAVRDFRSLEVADPTWRYGLGVWCERIEADGACSRTNSAGAFGTIPWIDRSRGRAGVFAARTRLPRVIAGALALRDLSHELAR